MRLLIERTPSSEVQTIGRMFVLDDEDFSEEDFPCLELPWKNNQRSVSCIPAGTYPVVKHVSPTFGKCFWVKDVPGRSEILIHVGNFYKNTRGCILPGMDLQEINGDRYMDVTASKKAMGRLLDLLPDSFNLEIVDLCN